MSSWNAGWDHVRAGGTLSTNVDMLPTDNMLNWSTGGCCHVDVQRHEPPRKMSTRWVVGEEGVLVSVEVPTGETMGDEKKTEAEVRSQRQYQLTIAIKILMLLFKFKLLLMTLL